jgi:hypothetical protein
MGWMVPGSNLGGARFSAPFQTNPGVSWASYATDIGSLSQGLAVARRWTPNPSSAGVKDRVELHFNSPSVFVAVYRVNFTCSSVYCVLYCIFRLVSYPNVVRPVCLIYETNMYKSICFDLPMSHYGTKVTPSLIHAHPNTDNSYPPVWFPLDSIARIAVASRILWLSSWMHNVIKMDLEYCYRCKGTTW